MSEESLDEWFMREVLPLEPAIVQFIRRNWGNDAEIDDLRQETYIRVYEAAGRGKPAAVKQFMFQIVRNLLLERQRQDKVIPFGSLADLEQLSFASDDSSPESNVSASQDLERLQMALDNLSERCRAVVIMRKVYGMPQRDVARHMGIRENTVEQHLAKGVRILAQSFGDRRGALIAQAKRYLKNARPA